MRPSKHACRVSHDLADWSKLSLFSGLLSVLLMFICGYRYGTSRDRQCYDCVAAFTRGRKARSYVHRLLEILADTGRDGGKVIPKTGPGHIVRSETRERFLQELFRRATAGQGRLPIEKIQLVLAQAGAQVGPEEVAEFALEQGLCSPRLLQRSPKTRHLHERGEELTVAHLTQLLMTQSPQIAGSIIFNYEQFSRLTRRAVMFQRMKDVEFLVPSEQAFDHSVVGVHPNAKHWGYRWSAHQEAELWDGGQLEERKEAVEDGEAEWVKINFEDLSPSHVLAVLTDTIEVQAMEVKGLQDTPKKRGCLRACCCPSDEPRYNSIHGIKARLMGDEGGRGEFFPREDVVSLDTEQDYNQINREIHHHKLGYRRSYPSVYVTLGRMRQLAETSTKNEIPIDDFETAYIEYTRDKLHKTSKRDDSDAKSIRGCLVIEYVPRSDRWAVHTYASHVELPRIYRIPIEMIFRRDPATQNIFLSTTKGKLPRGDEWAYQEHDNDLIPGSPCWVPVKYIKQMRIKLTRAERRILGRYGRPPHAIPEALPGILVRKSDHRSANNKACCDVILLRIHEITVGAIEEFLLDTSSTEEWRQQVFEPVGRSKARVKVYASLNRARTHGSTGRGNRLQEGTSHLIKSGKRKKNVGRTRADYLTIREEGKIYLERHQHDAPVNAEIEHLCIVPDERTLPDNQKSVELYYVTFIDSLDEVLELEHRQQQQLGASNGVSVLDDFIKENKSEFVTSREADESASAMSSLLHATTSRKNTQLNNVTWKQDIYPLVRAQILECMTQVPPSAGVYLLSWNLKHHSFGVFGADPCKHVLGRGTSWKWIIAYLIADGCVAAYGLVTVAEGLNESCVSYAPTNRAKINCSMVWARKVTLQVS